MLLQTAFQLAQLGEEVEAARERLKQLVAQGLAYDSPEMLNALLDFEQRKAQWDDLEKIYLDVKETLSGKNSNRPVQDYLHH